MVKIGDKVKFLNDVGGGVVSGFINKNTVNVEDENGFEIPYPISQLVNISTPELNAGIEETTEPANEIIHKEEVEFIVPKGEIINGKDMPNFYFCFVPTDTSNPLAAEIEMHLVNDSNFTVLFNYSHLKLGTISAFKQGTVQANSQQKIDTLLQEALSDLPEFCFQIIYFRESDNELKQPIVKKLRVNPVKFYKASTFQSNPYFRNNALVLQIANNPLHAELDKLSPDDFKAVVKAKEVKEKPRQKLQRKNNNEVVIDLHINELLDTTEGLSKRDILEIQKQKVESEMNVAIKNHVKQIVFIHGVGQGVLKQEVANLLQRKFKKYYFQDASFKEYGYGATLVTLRKG